MQRKSLRGLTLGPLIAATFFMVSGGPYGLEEIVGKAGYSRALPMLLVTPLVWSLPVAMRVPPPCRCCQGGSSPGATWPVLQG
jgi:hypothetical protein